MHVTPTSRNSGTKEQQPDQPPVSIEKKGGSRYAEGVKGGKEGGFAIDVHRQRVSVSGATLVPDPLFSE
jgi:hypothetical protein